MQSSSGASSFQKPLAYAPQQHAPATATLYQAPSSVPPNPLAALARQQQQRACLMQRLAQPGSVAPAPVGTSGSAATYTWQQPPQYTQPSQYAQPPQYAQPSQYAQPPQYAQAPSQQQQQQSSYTAAPAMQQQSRYVQPPQPAASQQYSTHTQQPQPKPAPSYYTPAQEPAGGAPRSVPLYQPQAPVMHAPKYAAAAASQAPSAFSPFAHAPQTTSQHQQQYQVPPQSLYQPPPHPQIRQPQYQQPTQQPGQQQQQTGQQFQQPSQPRPAMVSQQPLSQGAVPPEGRRSDAGGIEVAHLRAESSQSHHGASAGLGGMGTDKGKVSPHKRSSPIQVGEVIPPAHIDLHGVCVNLREFFGIHSGIIFGCVGAFNPKDTKEVVPKILASMELFERLVDFVGCLVVNDPFVVKAWARSLGVAGQFTFISDTDAKFTEALGMGIRLPEEGLGLRCRRFAAVIGPGATVRSIHFGDDALADRVLERLPRYVRTPWKSFLVGVTDRNSPRRLTDGAGSPGSSNAAATNTQEVVESLSTARQILSDEGFCALADWQLMLSDALQEVFRPTHENLYSGLGWLVEGAQAGDVLCFYYSGEGALYHPAGPEKACEGEAAFVPVDHATHGLVVENNVFHTVVPMVPEWCRLTTLIDAYGPLRLRLPLPFLHYIRPGSTGLQVERLSDVPEINNCEVLAISIQTTQPGLVIPVGTLAKVLAAVALRKDKEQLPVISIAAALSRLNQALADLGLHNAYVEIASTQVLHETDDFNLGDVLVNPATRAAAALQ